MKVLYLDSNEKKNAGKDWRKICWKEVENEYFENKMLKCSKQTW